MNRLKLPVGLTAATTVLAIAAGGCGEGAKKYDVETEAKLKSEIHPALVKVGRTALKLSREHPFDVVTRPDGKGGVRILGTSAGSTLGFLDVHMRRGSDKKPDPNQTVSADMMSSFTSPDGNETVRDQITLAAPGASKDNSHTEGWSAVETGSISGIGVKDKPYHYDTSSTNAFALDPHHPKGPTTATYTAQHIVEAMPPVLRDVVEAFERN